MKEFTLKELGRYDGKDGRAAYVAYQGLVYDVSSSYHWRTGIHQVKHPAGCDLTENSSSAPHSPDLLLKFPVIGKLKPAKQ